MKPEEFKKVSENMKELEGGANPKAGRIIESRVTDFQHSIIKGRKTLMTGASLFIAGTAILDMAVKAKQKGDAKDIQEAQDKQLKQKQKEQEKRQKEAIKMRKKETVGSIVFDMFNDRSGHHKMGNSRF